MPIENEPESVRLSFRAERDLILSLSRAADMMIESGKTPEDTAFILSIGTYPGMSDAHAKTIAEKAVELAMEVRTRVDHVLESEPGAEPVLDSEMEPEPFDEPAPPPILDHSAEYTESSVFTMPGCSFYTFNDILEFTPNKDHYIVGEGFIRRGAVTLLTGGTGIGKSVLTAQMSVSVAAGVPFLGCMHVHEPVRVLHIQAENDAETMQRDFCSCVKHSSSDVFMVSKNLILAHAYGITGLEFCRWLGDVVAHYKPSLIVVDPYQSFAAAGDMNNTAGFLEWHRPVQALIQQLNIALLLVAHTPKPRDRDGWNIRESVYMAAGTSALANWVRASMELIHVGQETERFKLRFGKNAERTGLIEPDGRRVVRELFLAHSGNIHEPFWRIADDQGVAITSKYQEQVQILALEHPEMSQRQIAQHLGCSVGTVAKYYIKGSAV
jgi:hypothetical protein